MSDITCPYCNRQQEVNHDDGYGYNEDELHSQNCFGCGEVFNYYTSATFYYDPRCRNEDHLWESWAPNHPNMEGCKRCDETRRIKPPKADES